MTEKEDTTIAKERGERERYEYRIPIRMTRGERVLIGRSACAVNMSVSRYLVENATTKRPLKAEDGARLRYLQELFAQTSLSVDALLPLVSEREGAVHPQIKNAAQLLRELSAEIARRLT